MSNRARSALTTVQRLAAMGLPSRLAFPEMVSALSEVAPFETAAMLWLGPDLQPIDTYLNADGGPERVARYAARWFNADEARYYPAQRDMQNDPALSVIRVSDFTPRFGDTELYDEVYREAGHHWIVGLALRDGGRPIGNLGLGRPARASDFKDAELQLLRQVRPYIVQALSRKTDPNDWPEADLEDDTAFLVTDLEGHLAHASPGAWRLLHAAAGIPADLPMMRDRTYGWAQPLLRDLAARVSGAVAGAPGPPARLDAVNVYGRFILRAYSLEPTAGRSESVGIQIERRLPVGLKMLRSQAFRALTRREQDVASLLTTSLSYPLIADRLGLSASTVVTHVRSLGFKLGAHGREQIVRALSGQVKRL